MTLATVAETTQRPVRLRQSRRIALSLNAFLMAGSLAVCAALFAQGGFEAFAGAALGAVIAARQAPRGARTQAAYSGGFAGLFAGALFAGFFHRAFAAALQLL